MNEDLFEMRSGADPMAVKAVVRTEHIGLIFRNLLGSAVTYAALHEGGFETLEDRMEGLYGQMVQEVRGDPERMAKQFQNAKERYVFLGEE